MHYKCQRDAAGLITYKANPGLDTSDIAKRIQTASIAERREENQPKPMPTRFKEFLRKPFQKKYIPKDMSAKERHDFLREVKKYDAECCMDGKTNTFDIWDFGGQYVFYATHTLFHSRKAIYLLVFNLSCGLTAIVPNDDEEICANMGERTMEYYIRFWVNSIHSFVGRKDGSEPKIILVGTHLDSLNGDASSKHRQATKYFENIRTMFKGTPAGKHISQYDFAVDNRNGQEDAFDALRTILLCVGRENAKSTKIPAKWIQLERSLFKYKHKGIVDMAKIIAIDSESEYPLSTTEHVKLFLKHKHDQGTLFYFDEKPISSYVVLDPQFLIDAFKCLITADRFIRNLPETHDSWLKLKTEGKLEIQLIDKIWGTAANEQIKTHKETILWFLQKHRIISEAMSFNETEEVAVGLGWYIVPSLLNDHSQAEEIKEFLKGKNQTKIQFVISFDNSSIVPTVYQRLTAALLGKWSISTFREKKLLFENMSIVRLDIEHAGIIEMNHRHIHLYVLNLCPSRKVNNMIPDAFRRFVESVIMYEFRKYQRDAGNNDLPYERGYTCNHDSHDISSCKTIELYSQLDESPVIPCTESESHDIITSAAKAEWFQGTERLKFLPQGTISQQTICKLSQYIGGDWEILATALGISRVKIEHIKADNPLSTALQVFRMLCDWREIFQETASMYTLVQELQKLPKVTVDWDGIRNIVDDLNETEWPHTQ
ncbi:uncharacterized protein LOC123544070 [Mercenaria mercenaria]|uniref:uncharacterized protein LOC123544070 n=1 Tax=Mercenaria mercenaria TaxID=6596 RepID=UPI00234F8D98|nr:uncharacterized protein LOC123544070 [Mercenaria mercenaria]